jgi:hypothetical protein
LLQQNHEVTGVVSVMIAYLASCLAHCAWHVLAASSPTAPPPAVDNPGPVNPVSGSNGVDLLISYAKWGALIACAGAALVSGGLMAIGSLSNRPDHADRGKRALIWSLGGVVITAIAIPVVNTIFGAVH